MGKTISEKILAKASGKETLVPGDFVWVSSPYVVVIGDTSPSMILQVRRLVATVQEPQKIIIVFDHTGVASAAAPNRARYRAFAKQMGIPSRNVYDLGRQGITHQIAAERGYALPGTVHLSQDTQATMLGALGAFAVPLSYETAAVLATEKTWLMVPESVKIEVSGKVPQGVMVRDLFEWLLARMGPDGAVYQAVEFGGATIDAMSIDGRLTLCALIPFIGAKTAIINPDEKTVRYVKIRTTVPFDPVRSDHDATYVDSLEFDVSNLEPQIVVPPKRHTVKPVSEVEGTEIDEGFIGSCADGRMEDLRIAARILKGKKVHPRVRLNITPASQEVFTQAAREGLLQIFGEADAFVGIPSCGMCGGGQNALVNGEVCVSTSTINKPGRMGSFEAKIYLASPATVAASAIEGRVVDPRTYLKGGELL